MSDIALAVGDGARRMTYAELAAVRGISPASAKRLAQRHRWGRQLGNDGVTRVTVPLVFLQKPLDFNATTVSPDKMVSPATGMTDRVTTGMTGPAPASVVTDDVAPGVIPVTEALAKAVEVLRDQLGVANRRVDELLYQLAEKGSDPDPLTVIGIQTLSQAVEMLREDVGHERDRAEQAERRIDELTEDRRRDAEERRQLLTDLADARTAAMITGCEAAALRTKLALVTERRPWWRKWFR